ncbi:MAG: hypothetical protein IJB76_00360 [Clostridia bacterium]|nr:hypothetical protein [Clostridia bacterium]
MNNTKSLNKKFKTKQFKAVLRLVVLIFTIISLLIGTAWSWFADQKEATASGISMTMQTADFLAVSIDGGNTFHSSIDILNDSMFENLDMRDLTSGDGKTLLIPAFTGEIGELKVDGSKTWSNAVENVDYISLPLTFRSSVAADIYIAAGTKVVTNCEIVKADGAISPEVLLGEDTHNPSSYGNFSKDAIVGALRMSAIDESNNVKFIWIPRPDVFLTVSNNLQSYALRVGADTIGTTSRTHYCYDSAYNPVSYAKTTLSSAGAFSADVNKAPADATTKLGTADTPDGNGYFTCNAHINIWFDGCDNEARRALSNGEYKLLLNFVAIPTNA